MKEKIKLTDRRVLLSNRYIQSLKPKDKRYSVGDSEVIGLRIFVEPTGIKTFYYLRTDSVIKGDLGSRMADCVACDG